ncbi:DoxX family protein [Egicoccus sp. AB-alg2]|uniref:DoxX family protein n=1 Tax=Egicoccus sp. AB-alg2 TaxID=3242693 RepID=UPI00359D2E70
MEADAAAVDAGLLLLRVLVGVVFAAHGFQKLFGWFRGGGFEGTAGWFRSLGFGDGRVAAAMAGTTEICGGLGLAAGLLTPFAAAGVIGVMTVAAHVNAREKGFWSVRNGWELNYYLMAVAFGLAVTGPGRWSLDAALGLQLRGLAVGLGALLVGTGLGTLRWVTRRRDEATA